MPNLELLFHVHDQGFKHKSMRVGALVGHREIDGKHKRKFTKRHYLDACQYVKQWMCDYNAMIDKPEPVKQVMAPANKDREPIKEYDIWACPGECKCHD